MHHWDTCVPALLDLALFFCIWTEASNLRHLPEALWFFFWAARQSERYKALVHACSQARGGHHVFDFPKPEANDERHALEQLPQRRMRLRQFLLVHGSDLKAQLLRDLLQPEQYAWQVHHNCFPLLVKLLQSELCCTRLRWAVAACQCGSEILHLPSAPVL